MRYCCCAYAHHSGTTVYEDLIWEYCIILRIIIWSMVYQLEGLFEFQNWCSDHWGSYWYSIIWWGIYVIESCDWIKKYLSDINSSEQRYGYWDTNVEYGRKVRILMQMFLGEVSGCWNTYVLWIYVFVSPSINSVSSTSTFVASNSQIYVTDYITSGYVAATASCS